MNPTIHERHFSRALSFFWLAVLAAGLLFASNAFGGKVALWLSVTVLVAVLLTVWMELIIDDSILKIRYGIGLLSTQVPLSWVRSCEIVPNAYLSWVYVPAQECALRLQLRNGKTMIVPTSQPKKLQALIQAAVRG